MCKVQLSEVLRHRRPDVAVEPLTMYEFAGVYSFGRGVFRSVTKRGSEFSYAVLTKLRKGEFVYPKLMAWEGAFGVVTPEVDGCYVSPEFPVFEVDRRRLLPEYLAALFRTQSATHRSSISSKGTNVRRQRLHPSALLRREIWLPPLATQEQIVRTVRAVESKVDEAERLRRRAEEHLMLAQTAAVRHLLRTLPTSKVPLRDVVEVRGGGTPEKNNPFFWSEGTIPWVSPKDMKSREIKETKDRVTPAALAETSLQMIPPNAVLIVVRGMILARTVPTALVSREVTINQDMKALVCGDRIAPSYLAEYLSASTEELLPLVERSTHDTRKLRTDVLLDFPVLLPSRSDQERVVVAINEIVERAAAIRRHSETLRTSLSAVVPAVLEELFRDSSDTSAYTAIGLRF